MARLFRVRVLCINERSSSYLCMGGNRAGQSEHNFPQHEQYTLSCSFLAVTCMQTTIRGYSSGMTGETPL
jgi:hypothetical protein